MGKQINTDGEKYYLNKKARDSVLLRYCFSKSFFPRRINDQSVLSFFMEETNTTKKPKNTKMFLAQLAMIIDRHQHHQFDLRDY